MYNQKGKLQKNPKEELILLHMPLVKKIANNMYKKINFLMDLDDLISVGTLGLMDAVQKYVEMDTAKFETYATIKIKGFGNEGANNGPKGDLYITFSIVNK